MPGETLLLVEDDGLVRKAVARTLRARGFQVLEADGGPAAMSFAERALAEFDLLLTDVQMPGMTGFELAESLRMLRPDLPVVFVSACLPKDGMNGCSLRDNVRFVPKPFTGTELVRTLEELLVPRS